MKPYPADASEQQWIMSVVYNGYQPYSGHGVVDRTNGYPMYLGKHEIDQVADYIRRLVREPIRELISNFVRDNIQFELDSRVLSSWGVPCLPWQYVETELSWETFRDDNPHVTCGILSFSSVGFSDNAEQCLVYGQCQKGPSRLDGRVFFLKKIDSQWELAQNLCILSG